MLKIYKMLSSHFKKRFFTALLLLIFSVSSVMYFNLTFFIAFTSVVFLLAAWEWSRLAGFSSLMGRLACVGSMIIVGFGVLILWYLKPDVKLLMSLPILFWCSAIICIFSYPKIQNFLRLKGIGFILGVFLLWPAFLFLIVLKQLDPRWILYIFALIWSCDTTAYIVGKRYGHIKLMPLISPHKTWEGVLGGLTAGFLVMVWGAWYVEPDMSMMNWILLSFITLVFSIVGDLFESLFKRLCGLKDSGILLPGHGGILDRLDSLMAAIPIFTAGLLF